jgi:hypothetical protein
MAISDYLLKNYKGCIFSIFGEDPSSLVWNENNPLPKPTEEELLANKDFVCDFFTAEEIANQEAIAINNRYKNLRANEYPSIQEQLDMQYWDKINGTNNWEQAIQAIKEKYPKPE